MLNQLATKSMQRLCSQSQGWQQETEIWPLPFPLLKKAVQIICITAWICHSRCHLGYCSADSLIPISTMSLRVWRRSLPHAPHFANWKGSSMKITSCGTMRHTLHCFCPEPLQLHPHMTSQCLTLPTTASSCYSDPPPKTFHPSSVKFSPSYLSSTRFMFVFKQHCSREMYLVHQGRRGSSKRHLHWRENSSAFW